MSRLNPLRPIGQVSAPLSIIGSSAASIRQNPTMPTPAPAQQRPTGSNAAPNRPTPPTVPTSTSNQARPNRPISATQQKPYGSSYAVNPYSPYSTKPTNPYSSFPHITNLIKNYSFPSFSKLLKPLDFSAVANLNKTFDFTSPGGRTVLIVSLLMITPILLAGKKKRSVNAFMDTSDPSFAEEEIYLKAISDLDHNDCVALTYCHIASIDSASRNNQHIRLLDVLGENLDEPVTWTDVRKNGSKFKYASYVGSLSKYKKNGTDCQKVFSRCPITPEEVISSLITSSNICESLPSSSVGLSPNAFHHFDTGTVEEQKKTPLQVRSELSSFQIKNNGSDVEHDDGREGINTNLLEM